MNGIEQTANILLNYGPAGAAVVLMFIAERKLYARLKDVSKIDHGPFRVLYFSNWVLISVFVFSQALIWVYHDIHKEVIIKGSIHDLLPSLVVSGTGEGVFFRKNRHDNFTFDSEWRYVGQTKPDHIGFFLSKSKTDWSKYKIPIKDIDMSKTVNLEYNNGTIFLMTAKGREKLKPVWRAADALNGQAGSGPSGIELIPKAQAGEPVKLSLLKDALSSDDPYTREEAANYLLQHLAEKRLLDWVDKTLAGDAGNDLLTLSMVSVLAKASSPDSIDKKDRPISQKAEQHIWRLALAKDHVMSSQARRYLVRNLDENSIVRFQELCGRHGTADDGELREKCSRLGLSIYYNESMDMRLQAQDMGQQKAITQLNKALQYLTAAEGLWRHDSADNMVQYGKVYYGEGLIHNDCAQIYMGSGAAEKGQRAVTDAKASFRDMLSFVNKHDPKCYMYPHHIKQAECYLNSADPGCFEKIKYSGEVHCNESS